MLVRFIHEEKKLICNVCGSKFYKKFRLRKHLVVHDDLVAKEEGKDFNVANLTRYVLQAETLKIII